MPRPRKSQDEKDLEKLAKKLLSMPQKPREEFSGGMKRKPAKKSTSRKSKRNA